MYNAGTVPEYVVGIVNPLVPTPGTQSVLLCTFGIQVATLNGDCQVATDTSSWGGVKALYR